MIDNEYQRNSASTPKAARRRERAQRILDAAAALILRWGYNKTTIDDVARQAGVAKGTIYLHWKTREELFAALMRRERLAMATDTKQRINADPAGATLHGILKHTALALMQRPLLKAALLGDMEVIGKLAHSEHSSAAYIERLAGFTGYIEFLREHGLVRADMSVAKQVYVFSAIFMGFFVVAPLMPSGFELPDAEVAELIADTAQRSLGPGRPVADDELQTLAQAFSQYMDRATVQAEARFQHELE